MTLTTNSITSGTVPKGKPGKTRIACYERVSTEEQAIHGYSIPAQKEVLTAYCKSHDHIIIGHYTDEGISGAKPATTARKTQINVGSIESKLKRLAETYTDGLIDRETYKRKLAELTTQLETARNAPRIVSKPPEALTREILKGDLQTVYNRFTRQEKRRFWQTVLTSLVVGADYSIIRLAFNTAPSLY